MKKQTKKKKAVKRSRHDGLVLRPVRFTGANWDRLRVLINTGLGSLSMVNMPVNDNEMEVAHGLTIWWDAESETYAVTRSIIIPGVHTFPNGDPGYPDDVEIVAVAEFKANEQVSIAEFICAVIARDRIGDAVQALFECEMAAEFYREEKLTKSPEFVSNNGHSGGAA